MPHRPASDVASFLQSQGIATPGRDLFEGPPRAVARYIPSKCIFVEPRPGPAPARVFGSKKEIRFPHVQIHVRSTGYSTGYEVAMDIYEALESAEVALAEWPEGVARDSEDVVAGSTASVGSSTDSGIAWVNFLMNTHNPVYIDSFNLQSQPVYLGLDENHYERWSINCEIWYNFTT